MEISREELFRKKLEELLQFVLEKDQKYSGDKPLNSIVDNAKAFNITPLKFCLLRINDKWNRVRNNPEDVKLIAEELRDIWGYAFEGLILIDMEEC